MTQAETLRHMAALQHEQALRCARENFRVFAELTWRIAEPSTPFMPNFHIDVICEYLQAVTLGRKRHLAINLPPRSGKSLIVSVLWPLWEWVRKPSTKFLCVSHSDALALKFSVDRRRILEHEWFRTYFPEVRLYRGQNEKAEFHNTRGGVMVSTSMSGSITGKGGDRIIIDDPHTPDQAVSDAQREHAVERFRSTLSTRLNDKARGAIVLVGQRLHTRDLSGVCLELGFEPLCFEAIATQDTTIVCPITQRVITRNAGEALWAAREDLETLAGIARTIGSYAWAGQYQQHPVPLLSHYFREEWWQYVDVLPPLDDLELIQSYDLTFTDGPRSDFVAGLVLGRRGEHIYILDRVNKRMGFNETIETICAMVAKYPTTKAVLVEKAANGPAVIDALSSRIRGLIAVPPEGGKVGRAHAVLPQIEAGQVFLPSRVTRDGQPWPGRGWVSELVTAMAAFPNGRYDDDVDAFTQGLVWFNMHRCLMPASAFRSPDPVVPAHIDARGEAVLARMRKRWNRPRGDDDDLD